METQGNDAPKPEQKALDQFLDRVRSCTSDIRTRSGTLCGIADRLHGVRPEMEDKLGADIDQVTIFQQLHSAVDYLEKATNDLLEQTQRLNEIL